MSDHVELYINGAKVFDSAATTQPPDTTPPDTTPPDTTPPPSGIYEFSWDHIGQTIHFSCEPGQLVTFAYDVPATFAGRCWNQVAEASQGTPGTVRDLQIWQSESPGGPAIAGTEYRGMWMTGAPMPTGVFSPSGGRRYYFNAVMHDISGTYIAGQNHA